MTRKAIKEMTQEEAGEHFDDLCLNDNLQRAIREYPFDLEADPQIRYAKELWRRYRGLPDRDPQEHQMGG